MKLSEDRDVLNQQISFILYITICWSFLQQAIAHPGGLDTSGGHYNRSTSVYHCHSASCSDLSGDAAASNTVIKRYSRKDWRHWIDEDGDCQNTRAEVLISRSKEKVEFATSRGCRVVKGSWIGGLTGILLSNASDVDIDHVIPLSYAHRHGGSSWSPSKKERFANDPLNLLPAYDLENRRKSDKGPSKYLPSDKNLACAYIKRWQAIGVKYGLNIASDDMDIIRDVLDTVPEESFC